MKKLATLAAGGCALALLFVSVAPDEASAGWRRANGYYGYPAYVYPRWRGYGWGWGPYAKRNFPYAYYPFWRGRYSYRGCC